MSKDSALLLFGGLVILVSFLGIPSSWKTIIVSVLGVIIIVITLLLRKDITSGTLCMHLTKEKQTDSYKQNGVLRDKSNTVDSSDTSVNSEDLSPKKEHENV